MTTTDSHRDTHPEETDPRVPGVPDDKPFSFGPRAKRRQDRETSVPDDADESSVVEEDSAASVVEDDESPVVEERREERASVSRPPRTRSEPTPDPDTDPATRRRLGTPALTATAVVLVGLLVLVLGLVSWYRAGHDDALDTAKARDRALVAATTEVATLNSLDYRDVDAGLKAWLAATTGTLHDQLGQAGAKDKATLASQKKVTTAKVVGAALTDLDVERGTATAITSVEITVRGTSGEPVLKRNRFSADLTLTKKGWLLSSLTQVPVDVS